MSVLGVFLNFPRSTLNPAGKQRTRTDRPPPKTTARSVETAGWRVDLKQGKSTRRKEIHSLICLLSTLSQNNFLAASARSVFNSFQIVKDQLSSSSLGFRNPGEPGRSGQKVIELENGK